MSEKKEVAVTTKQNGLPDNPFARNLAEHVNAGTVQIEESRAIAEAQGKLIIAKKFPRDENTAMERILKACTRKSFAEVAMYSYPKGGEVVKGPSIRLAELIAAAMGNIEFGLRELSQRNGESEMEAYCWDLETNTISSQKFAVKHERHTKQGVRKLTDMRDIYEMTANQGARRMRARILAIVPQDIVDTAVAACANTIAGGEAYAEKVGQDSVNKMLRAFKTLQITQSDIEARLGKPCNEMTNEQYGEMLTIFNSIKDNASKASDWFTTVNPAADNEEGLNNLNAKLKTAAAAETDVDTTKAKTEDKVVPEKTVVPPVQQQPPAGAEDDGDLI